MEPSEIRAAVADLSSRLSDARGFLDIEGKEAELIELRELASAPDLWNDQDHAREVTSRLSRHEQTIAHVQDLATSIEDIGVLLELGIEEGDAASLREVESELGRVTKEMALLERESLFFGEYDDSPAIVSIYSGAAASTPRTGPRCCCGCTCATSSGQGSPSSWTRCSRARRRASSPPP